LDLLDTWHYEGGKVVTLTHRPPLSPGSSWYSFLEAESTPKHMVPSEPQKTSPAQTTGDRSRDPLTSSTVILSRCASFCVLHILFGFTLGTFVCLPTLPYWRWKWEGWGHSRQLVWLLYPILSSLQPIPLYKERAGEVCVWLSTTNKVPSLADYMK
jgi:hypothetical protein